MSFLELSNTSIFPFNFSNLRTRSEILTSPSASSVSVSSEISLVAFLFGMSLVTPYFFINFSSETCSFGSTVSSPSSFSSDISCSLASLAFSSFACSIISDSAEVFSGVSSFFSSFSSVGFESFFFSNKFQI